MRLLDRYIIRQFLGTFAFMIGVFCVIAVVFDVAENIDDLIHSEASLWRILTDYYLNFCLNLGNTLSAFIVFLTIIWFTSRLAQRSEIIATLAAGVSLGRLMRPYMVAATLLVAGSLLLSHVILPHANSTKVDFEFEFIHKDFYIAEQNMYREVAPGTMVYFRSMAPMRSVGYRFVMDCWVGGSVPDGGERRLAEKWVASKANWIPADSTWRLANVRVRTIAEDGTEEIAFHARLDTALDMRLEDFGRRTEAVSTLDFRALDALITSERAKGSSGVTALELERHGRTSGPFSIFVMTLIGVSVASRRRRGGTGIHILIAVVIGFTYVFSSKITAVAATNAGISPILAAWLPNLLYGALGLWIYRKAPQ
jgi:lipopolysaccharide export system permease protein